MHRAVLLGCGTIGSAVAHMLAADPTFAGLVLVDRDVQRARQLAAAIGDKAAPAQAEAEDEAALANLAREAAVVLNTTGPFTSRVVSPMQAALQAGVPYADINDEAEVLWELFEAGKFDTAARQCRVPLVVGLGISPGFTNIWARHLADQLDAVSALHIAIVSDPSYRNPTVFRHRFSTHGGQVIVFRDGGWQRLAGFSEEEIIRFPEPVGSARVHLAGHCEPVTLPRFIPGLRAVDMKAGFSVEAVNRLLHTVIRYGLTSTEPLWVEGTRVSPAAFTAAFLSSPAADHLFRVEQHHGHVARQVQAIGRRAGKPCRLTLQVVMPAGAAMTALPLAVAARLLATGQVPTPGLLAPELLAPQPFLEAQERHGIRLHIRYSGHVERDLARSGERPKRQ